MAREDTTRNEQDQEDSQSGMQKQMYRRFGAIQRG